MEKQILSALEQINLKLDKQDKTLYTHGEMLKEQGEILKVHGKMLKNHGEVLNIHSELLKAHSELFKTQGAKLSNLEEMQRQQGAKLSNLEEMQQQQGAKLSNIEEVQRLQGETLKEHTSLIKALINGQESLKAELSEMRLQNAKDFGEIKGQIKGIEDSIDLLKEDIWMNKKDIRRIQKTMGMC
ncbi:hypothetical protein KDN24_04905 [Bacillus sp. Bva_UNVM-123]